MRVAVFLRIRCFCILEYPIYDAALMFWVQACQMLWFDLLNNCEALESAFPVGVKHCSETFFGRDLPAFRPSDATVSLGCECITSPYVWTAHLCMLSPTIIWLERYYSIWISDSIGILHQKGKQGKLSVGLEIETVGAYVRSVLLCLWNCVWKNLGFGLQVLVNHMPRVYAASCGGKHSLTRRLCGCGQRKGGLKSASTFHTVYNVQPSR